MICEYLGAHARRPQLWVRINPLDGEGLVDAAAVVRAAPDGLVVPKVSGPAELLRVSHWLDALEAREGLPLGGIRLLAVATETAAAVLGLSDYARIAVPRLHGLTWGAEDLAAALGASSNQDAGGGLSLTYRIARSACLVAAVAANAQPIDTLEPDFRNEAALHAACAAARREGFTGKIAIHPAQVRRSMPASARPPRRSPSPAAWWRPSQRTRASARWGWTARCSTCRICGRPSGCWRRTRRSQAREEVSSRTLLYFWESAPAARRVPTFRTARRRRR